MDSHFYSDHHPLSHYIPYPSDSDILPIIPLDVRKESIRKRPKYTRYPEKIFYWTFIDDAYRSKLGCLTCRSKKVKCDELKPKCTRCTLGHREVSDYLWSLTKQLTLFLSALGQRTALHLAGEAMSLRSDTTSLHHLPLNIARLHQPLH
jgi:hypothetical protein